MKKLILAEILLLGLQVAANDQLDLVYAESFLLWL